MDKAKRLEKIREAKAAFEAEAAASSDDDDDPEPPSGGGPRRDGTDPQTAPKDKAQRNFTDPESKILKTKDGFIQG